MSRFTVRRLAQTHRVVVSVTVFLGLSSVATAAGAEPDCQCRDPTGTLLDLGTVACVPIGQTRYLVRCEMSTNTPYWRRVLDDPGCPPVT